MTDWINDFIEITEGTSSPPLFRKWAAIATVSGALERKTWVHTLNSNLYPNVYVILVAPPGVGKTEVTWRVRDLWESLEDQHVARTSVTKASLIDELNDADRRIVMPEAADPVVSFHSLKLCVNELGVFLPAYDSEIMNALTDIYDCKGYSERRRTKGLEIDIPDAQLTFLTATTPSYLNQTLPEGAWDQGFLSRTFLIYNGDKQLRSLFNGVAYTPEGMDDLKKDLQKIGNLFGEFKFTPEAAKFIDHWHLNGQEPVPDEFKLIHYNTRRTAHLLKLSMIACASEYGKLTITQEHIERAMGWMFEAELHMPDIFKSMSSGGTGNTIQETWHYLFKIYMKENEPVQEHRLMRFLQERVPVHSILPTIEMMEKSKLIEHILTKTGKAYRPKGQQPK